MFEGFEMGTLWKMKNAPDFTTYRVIMNSIGADDGPEVGFDREDQMVTYTVTWARENMEPVI